MKICTKCNQEKELCCFPKDKTTKDGHHPSCKECRKETKRLSYLRHRVEIIERQRYRRRTVQDWVNQFKTECTKCGEKHLACLDFHHTSDKENGIAALVSQRTLNIKQQKLILAEIQKCIVLCSNCHRKLHWNERRDSIV